MTAYRTVRAAPPAADIREAIKGGGFDAVVFTSSSTVRNLVGIAGKPHASTVIACIGPATAKTAEEHGLRVDVLAPNPSVACAERGAGRVRYGGAGRGPRAGRADLASVAAARGRSAQGEVAVGGPGFPVERPRRLRRSAALRRLVAETRLAPADLVLPLFVKEGLAEPVPVSAMPGVVQHTRDSLRKAAHEAVEAGVGGLILFGIPSTKDADGLAGRRRRRRRAGGPARPGRRPRRLHRRDGRPVPVRVHRPRPLRAARRRRRGRQRPHPRPLRVGGGGAGAGRRPGHRPLGHAGRPGRGDPGRARRRRVHRRPGPRLRREVRLRLLRPVPRGRRVDARHRRPAGRTRWTRPTASRPCARSRSTSPRAPTR